MTDTDSQVDRVWAAMLETPGPPLPTAEETLQTARASRRRRVALAVAGSGLASVLVIASVAVGAALVGPRADAPTAHDPVIAAPVAPGQPPPPAPDWEAADAHGAQIGAILLAAVPAGYTGLLQQLSTNGPAATFQFNHGPRYASSVDVIVTTGRADGMLSVSIYGGIAPLGDDICSAAATAYLDSMYSPYPATCDVVIVNGVQIRLSSAHEDARGDVNRATRLLDGGVLTVEAQQGIPVHLADDNRPPDAATERPDDGEHSILGGWPALPAVPLTAAQLAAIAADPALLP